MYAGNYQTGYQQPQAAHAHSNTMDMNRYNEYVRDYYKKYQEIQIQQQMQLQNSQGLINTNQNINKSMQDMNAITITDIVDYDPAKNFTITENHTLNKTLLNTESLINEKTSVIATEDKEIVIIQGKSEINLKTSRSGSKDPSQNPFIEQFNKPETDKNTVTSNNNSIKNSINFDEKIDLEKNTMILMQNELTKSQISNDQENKIFFPEMNSLNFIIEKDNLEKSTISPEKNQKKESDVIEEELNSKNEQNTRNLFNMSIELSDTKINEVPKKSSDDFKSVEENTKFEAKNPLKIETNFLDKEESFKKKELEFKLKQQNNFLSIPSFGSKNEESSSNFIDKEGSQSLSFAEKIKISFSPKKSEKKINVMHEENPFNLEMEPDNASIDEKSSNTFDIVNQIDLKKISFNEDQEDLALDRKSSANNNLAADEMFDKSNERVMCIVCRKKFDS